MNRIKSLLLGTMIGTIAAMVLTVVPMYGVRKSIEKLFLNWQEVVFVSSTIATGAMVAALIVRSKLNLLTDARISKVKVEVVEQDDDAERFIPKSNKKFKFIGGFRAKLSFSCLYLLLYINLSILCDHFRLGIIDIAGLNVVIRSTGALIAMFGLYTIIKGVRYAKTIPYFCESSYYDSEIGLLGSYDSSDSLPEKKSHIPPVSFHFFASHPILKGWYLYIIGLPLVFAAWFPLLALPGVFIGLNWLYQNPTK